MKTYVLDACALMAVLYGEKGVSVVKATFYEVDIGVAKIIMHKANLLEVYYDLMRSIGKDKVDIIISEIKKRPIRINAEIT
jgi:PIN domain nuclease of toxin-antitoxin system